MIQNIHQIWFQGRTECPDKYAKAIARWSTLHPEAQYHFWDETSIEAFISKEFPQYYEEWVSIDIMIKKCDCARYLILYHYGGIYADVDTYPIRSLDLLLKNEDLSHSKIILSEESGDPASWKREVSREILKNTDLERIVGNAVLISQKDQYFWLEFVERAFEKKDEKVLESFSTWHLTRFLEESSRPEIAVLPYQYLLGSDPENDKAYCLHFYDASWFDTSLEFPWEV